MQQQGGRLRNLCLTLSSDAERWIEELRLHGIRPTLGYGMMLRCSAHVEQLLRECSVVVLRLLGDEGLAILRGIHSSALVEKLTMGQLIRFLRAVVPLLKEARLVDDIDDQTWALLDTVRSMRNAFMHARQVREDAALWIEYLAASRDLCQTRLVRAVIDAEERGMIQERQERTF
jgi:hypothetical protein